MLLSIGSVLSKIWSTAWPIIIAILLFAIVIIIHEFGHFFFAKRFKVKVNEFAVGFGPTLLKKKKGETTYSWRLIPFGGFCSMEGEDEESEDENAFQKKAIWKRIIIVAAGGFNNIVLGLLLISIMLTVSGSFLTTTVRGFYYRRGDINKDGIISSADASLLEGYLGGKTKFDEIQLAYADVNNDGKVDSADLNLINEKSNDIKTSQPRSYATGLRTGDNIKSVDGRSVYCSSDLSYMMMSATGNSVDMIVERNGEEIELKNVEFEMMELDGKSYIANDFAVESVDTSLKHPLTLMKCAVKETASLARIVWMTLFDMIRGRFGLNDIMGPIGVVSTVSDTVSQVASSDISEGIGSVLYIMSLITVNLGIVNLLPLPALDGGRILILICEGIVRKKLPAKAEALIHGIGFALLMILILVITGNDIIRLFK